MKKQQIILLAALACALIIATATVFYVLSFKKVSITLADNVTEAVLSNEQEGKELQTINESKDISLQAGRYSLTPKGERVDTTKIEFEVNNDPVEITVDPGYSEQYLQTVLNQERTAISNAIKQKYPAQMNNYTLNTAKLYNEGEWFGGLLVLKGDVTAEGEYYRIIAKKQNNAWTIIKTPVLVATYSEFGDVPQAIVKKVNELQPVPVGR